jgi:DNA-binding MarR family transcriptional regulator
MSSRKDRNTLVAEIGQMARDHGNLNVLMVNAIAQHVGLSATEFECCSLIADEGPFTAGELARRCRITTGGMTGMIDRLERAGFAERKIDPNDRRRVLVSAIEQKKAAKLVCELYQPLQESFDKIMSEYTLEQLEVIAHFFHWTNRAFCHTLESLPERHDSSRG